ncbi:hypothetical protein LTR17_026076 [Elasticomyces elasticus]|nr:hypothetical protein LTR17_026076 [Elasticomyces elasticus]
MDDIPQQEHLFPVAIDYRAKHTPDKVYAVLPKGTELEHGFFNLTYAAFAKAVDAMAWWLDQKLGAKAADRKFDQITAVPYIGPDDFRYVLIIIAAMKTGRVAMTPFPANTPEGLVHLLELTKSDVVFATPSYKHVWSLPLAQKPEIPLIEVPDVGEFVHDGPVDPYVYGRTYSEGVDDPHVLIQTSGTTGTPKPIAMNNRLMEEYIGAVASLSRKSPPTEKMAVYALLDDSYAPNLLPMSWAAALGMTIWLPMYSDKVPIMLPPESIPKPITADYIKAIGKHGPRGERNGIVLVPDVLRHLVRDPEGRESLKAYEWVAYVGAPLDHETGDAVTAMGVRVQSMIGSTDTGLYDILLNDPQDWKVHRFKDGLSGFYMEHFTGDLYELCTKRQVDDPRHVFKLAPDSTVFHTRDLWRSVPGREGFWMNVGRVDDFVKLSSMTKFNAIAIESVIEANLVVAKCVVAGDSRPKSFILVEPSLEIRPYDSTPAAEVVDRVWPSIEAANKHLLPETRLTKELVIITQPGKPILRTAKGTVSRRATLEMYEKKIEEAYETAGYEAVPVLATGEVMAKTNVHSSGAANGHVW